MLDTLMPSSGWSSFGASSGRKSSNSRCPSNLDDPFEGNHSVTNSFILEEIAHKALVSTLSQRYLLVVVVDTVVVVVVVHVSVQQHSGLRRKKLKSRIITDRFAKRRIAALSTGSAHRVSGESRQQA